MRPQTCHAVIGAAGPAGRAPLVSSSASVAIGIRSLPRHGRACPGHPRSFIHGRGCPAQEPAPDLIRAGHDDSEVAAHCTTVLIRASISSTAVSTGTFSLATRFMALAQTFSLLRMVNL